MFSIRTTYPDRICYRLGVMITSAVCFSWGIRMELRWIAMRAPCHQGEGSLHLVHADGPPCDAQISHSRMGKEDVLTSPVRHIQNSVRRHFTFWYLTAGWERRTFQLLRSDISGSSDSAYPESFSLSIQCRGVLLKLPDRHFEIFCFRYLMSKSPKSPCNPPIIGFLSL